MLREYPEPRGNPAPHGGDEDAWRAWADRLHIAVAFGVRCTAIGPRGAVFEVSDSPIPLNPIGSVHGGIIAAIADHALGAVVVPTAGPGRLPATASLTIEYHRPAFLPLKFDARVTSAGRSLVFCDVEVTGGDGKVSNVCRGIMAVKGAPRRSDRSTPR